MSASRSVGPSWRHDFQEVVDGEDPKSLDRPKKFRWTDQGRSQMASLHARGMSTRSIAEVLGADYTTVHKALRAAGLIQLIEQSPGPRAKLTASQAIEIYSLRDSGQGRIEVASRFGITPQRVKDIWEGKTWRLITGAR